MVQSLSLITLFVHLGQTGRKNRTLIIPWSELIVGLGPYYPCVQFLSRNSFSDSTFGSHTVM